jgi:hypothetical protein
VVSSNDVRVAANGDTQLISSQPPKFERELPRARRRSPQARQGARCSYGATAEAHRAPEARRAESLCRRNGDPGRLGAAVQCRSEHHIEARGINARNIAKREKSSGSHDPISRSSGECRMISKEPNGSPLIISRRARRKPPISPFARFEAPPGFFATIISLTVLSRNIGYPRKFAAKCRDGYCSSIMTPRASGRFAFLWRSLTNSGKRSTGFSV